MYIQFADNQVNGLMFAWLCSIRGTNIQYYFNMQNKNNKKVETQHVASPLCLSAIS